LAARTPGVLATIIFFHENDGFERFARDVVKEA
jgi:hypothetical protein